MAKRRTHLEVLSDLTNETLEGELPDEELSRLLVAPNFTESDSSGPEPVRLLNTTRRIRRRRLACLRLGCELFTRGLACGCCKIMRKRENLEEHLPPVDLRAVCLVRAIVVVVGCWRW